ncbi:hypothetical protein GA0115240_11469 [Streptomyces sp. DvalAA-14]|uniref:hypothetical protein n=1 Tax=unclassified Streptomyces TaxID=2593676 RepID=UPI00081BB5D0|nr:MULTISPECIES: hypothetical protein [unclassified Streptomyces]MYS19903.1 hypothetical protein [Streptomyces sp. SID4948]SCD56062.1 hypothetical protein GA0115240_11469 [Streptomyces sp. DvalAA-14]
MQTLLTGAGNRRSRRRALWLVAALLLIAAGLLLEFGLRDPAGPGTPRAGGGRAAASAAASGRAHSGGSVSASAGASASSAVPCPGPDLAGVGGTGAGVGAVEDSWRKTVEPVYRAACARDYPALSRLLAGGSAASFLTDDCAGCTGQDLVAMWRDEYGVDGTDLARLLMTRPVVDQGGLTYADGDALAIFGRGTGEIPAQWSAFYPDCSSDDQCRRISALLPGTG